MNAQVLDGLCDFELERGPAVALLVPRSGDAMRWIAENLPTAGQMCGAIVLNAKRVDGVIADILGDDLSIESHSPTHH